jgi:hypothetical protein
MPRVKIGPALPDRTALDVEIAHLRDLDVAGLRRRWHSVGALDADSESMAEEPVSRRGSDSRSVHQIVPDHQANMARIYEELDHELSEAWRRS